MDNAGPWVLAGVPRGRLRSLLRWAGRSSVSTAAASLLAATTTAAATTPPLADGWGSGKGAADAGGNPGGKAGAAGWGGVGRGGGGA